MTASWRVACVSVIVLAGALAPAARAATPASGTIGPGGVLDWTGPRVIAGANTSNTLGNQLCSPSYPGGPNDPGSVPGVHQCDVFQFTVNVPPGYWDTHKGGVSIRIDWTEGSGDPSETCEGGDTDDFDMYVYRKPPAGEPVGPPLASSAQGATFSEQTRLYRPEGTFLVRVNPWAVDNCGYKGQIRFFNLQPIPNVPGGITQFRASHDIYNSHSEPHVAVNPLNPNHLVASSKMYQNLERYRFKIGTYVSFDGGRTWRDNGHLPGYPRETGNEDDYHITSDPWNAFDDEGNAYQMVLDSPPVSRVTGAGWGMNLHKSRDGGRTWSGPISIERKDDPVTRELFLSDKNTMVVDNFGPDRDGKTGNMYACWSEDAPVANLFVEVKRSTDGGQTWTDSNNASRTDRTVIGCYLVVGPPEERGQPGVVYVFWLDFAGEGRMRMAKSTDGGESFGAPQTVARIHQVPRIFPNSAFRNLSIPYAGVDPRDGTVYLTWSDYRAKIDDPELDREDECPPSEDAPTGQVCDADNLIVSSTDGGETWKGAGGCTIDPTDAEACRPIRVNRDAPSNGKDQFQPALAVTESGQLNMMWFDRRNDPQNFYIDTFFARSNDKGRTWRELRVTKTMWDPSVNPPISGSGQFIGDYQGIAATDCFAAPFWNDTTLHNLPLSDRRYSPWQEVFSANIPNTAAFGGTSPPASCPRQTTTPTPRPRRPRIRLRVHPRRVRTRTCRRYRFRATALRRGRRVAVRGARVRFGGKSRLTNRSGRTSIRKCFRRAGRKRASAAKRGYLTGRTSVRVVRRRARRAPSFTG